MDENNNISQSTQYECPPSNDCQPASSENKGFSIAAMVLGIVGCLGPFVCSILAIIFAAISLNRGLSGRKMAITGLVTGIVGLAWVAIVIVLVIVSLSAVALAGIGI